MKQYLLSLAGAGMLLFTISACSNDDQAVMQDEALSTPLTEISVSIQKFNGGATTRVAATASDAGVSFAWENGDKIGVFPQSGAQASFAYNSTDKKFAVTEGEELAGSTAYTAYYPYVSGASSTSVTVSYAGQKQTGDNSTAHIGKYDYMASAATAPADGKLSLNLKHLGTLMRFKMQIPTAGKITKLTFSTDADSEGKGAFATEGTIDLTAGTPAFVGTKFETSISLDLDITTTADNQNVTFYMMMPPTDLTGKTVKATITYADNSTKDETLTGWDLNPSYAYKASDATNKEVSRTWKGTMCYDSGWVGAFTPNKLKSATLTRYTDGTYSIENGYVGTKVDFTVDANSQLTFTNATDYSGLLYYVDSEDNLSYYVYGGTYSYADISSDEVNIWWTDYNTASRYVRFTNTDAFVGTLYYNLGTDSNNDWDFTSCDSKVEKTLVKNSDGSYTIKQPYDFITEMIFTINSDTSLTLMNPRYSSGTYFYYWEDEDTTYNSTHYYQSVCYYGGAYSYGEINTRDEYIQIYIYRYDMRTSAAGYDYFEW